MINLKGYWSVFALGLGILTAGHAQAYESCDLHPAVAEAGATLFDGQGSEAARRGNESTAAYVKRIRAQSQLVRELLRLALTDGMPAGNVRGVTGWASLIEGIDDDGHDLQVYRHPDTRDQDRQLYEVQWHSGDTGVAALIEVLGRMNDESGRPHVLKIVAKMGDGDWFDCDSTVKKRERRGE